MTIHVNWGRIPMYTRKIYVATNTKWFPGSYSSSRLHKPAQHRENPAFVYAENHVQYKCYCKMLFALLTLLDIVHFRVGIDGWIFSLRRRCSYVVMNHHFTEIALSKPSLVLLSGAGLIAPGLQAKVFWKTMHVSPSNIDGRSRIRRNRRPTHF